jgi:chromosome partitioning protein
MALVICVALMKGGVAKTTTAVALAEAAALGTSTMLLDADPMGSAYRWSRLAAESGQPLRSTVVPMAAADLPRRIEAATRGAAVVVIDAPPPGPGAEAIERAAVSVADLVVMPTPPEFAALDRIQPTAKAASAEGKRAVAVLTMVRAGLADREAALAALASWGVPVAAAELPLTVSVQRNYGQAVTAGVLARFGIDLMSELIEGIG